MKPARWIFTWDMATVGWDGGQPVQHAFVDGLASPICQPDVPGVPPQGENVGHVRYCGSCLRRFVHGTWSAMPWQDGFVWHVRTKDSRRFDIHAPSLADIIESTERGLAKDLADAMKQALAAIDRLVPGDIPVEIHRGGEYELKEYVRELRADARAQRPSKQKQAQLTEYIYRHTKEYTSWFSLDFTWSTKKFRITKKTPKRIFVEASTRTTEKGNTVLRQWSLDRAALERGEIVGYGWTLDPNPPFAVGQKKPGWADVLGVEVTCTPAQAKSAFRVRAKETHPDSGGSAEAFQRVKAAYDAALEHFEGRSAS